ncbi:MAG: prolyl oligopeptidase family serine peptidase, partial [Bacteroidales bacterium]|nr:prolyl oligopeptidase family serine peptidase [Bacteroidales bacterium]
GRITPEGSIDICDVPGAELPTEPFSGIEQLCWHPDSRHIAYSCRKLTGKRYAFSTNTDIYVYDLLTGATVRITDGGGYDTDPVWSEDGLSLAWISMARDGYEADKQDLMVADIEFPTCGDGQCADVNVKSVRKFEFGTDASSPVWHNGKIYFNSIAGEAVQAVFCADPQSGEIRRLTKPDWNCDFFTPWNIRETDEGQVLYTSCYSLNFPLELVKINPEAGTFEMTGSENAHILSQLDEPTFESVRIKTVDGKTMQAWVLYPPHFDETKVYPAIEIVLGGPQGTLSQDWSYRWCYRLMAQLGYIVIMPNRRGTTAFGQQWKEQISGDYSGLNMQDYLSAGRWIKSKPYVGKLACCGASYGGYSAYMLEGLHGDLYDCFIAHAGIFDEKQLWFTTEEMWFANWDNGGLTEYAFTPGETGPRGDGKTFGGMQQAGAPYANTPKAIRHYASAPSSMVTKWHTPILCIHGGKDFRIPYEQGMAAFNAAQMMGIESKLIIFPEENHWIIQPQNALFWHRSYFEWLDRWCKENQ